MLWSPSLNFSRFFPSVLVFVEKKDSFYAMESVCAHEGGPLEMGDIEDAGDDKWVLVCPWHHFEFDVETGDEVQ